MAPSNLPVLGGIFCLLSVSGTVSETGGGETLVFSRKRRTPTIAMTRMMTAMVSALRPGSFFRLFLTTLLLRAKTASFP